MPSVEGKDVLLKENDVSAENAVASSKNKADTSELGLRCRVQGDGF